MSEKLYKLGKWGFAHRWRMVSLWVLAFIVMGGLTANFMKPFETKLSIPGTEAQTAMDKLSGDMPDASNASGSIVFAVPEGQNVNNAKQEIEQTVDMFSKADGVERMVSPFAVNAISEDGRIAYAQINLNNPVTDVTQSVKDELEKIREQTSSEQLQVEMKGDYLGASGPTGVGPGEVGGIIVAVIVLVVTFGSIVAAGMPLLIALVAVGLGMMGVLTATGFTSVPTTSTTLASMLGLAVGIDYALFLIIRYIKYLKDGHSPKEAAGRAVATAGNAVIFAALTVIIALVALAVTGVPFLGSMGLFAAITVAIAAFAAITLTPALLSFAKYKVLNKKARKQLAEHKANDENRINHRSISYRWVSMLTKKPVAVIAIVVVLLGLAAIPAAKLHLGLPNDGNAASDTTQRKAYDLLSEGFGEGFNGPLVVVADLPKGLSAEEQQSKLDSISANIKKEEGVAKIVSAIAMPNSDIGIVQVIPQTGPNDIETRDLIEKLRKDADSIAGSNTQLSITGSTAVSVDIDNKLAASLPKYLVVVVGLSLLILLVVFRSIVVPIKATVGFLLTIAATLGLLVMVFQWGWLGLVEAGPILSFLPIIVTGILFGLAMDYQFFLVSGMHEEYAHDKEKDAKRAVVQGFAHNAKVVTAAAAIMIAVFSGFIFAGDNMIRSIGFTLAIGVLIDAFLVRMTIVPAVMALFKQRAWWLPAWVDRKLPNVSIEGNESVFAKK